MAKVAAVLQVRDLAGVANVQVEKPGTESGDAGNAGNSPTSPGDVGQDTGAGFSSA